MKRQGGLVIVIFPAAGDRNGIQNDIDLLPEHARDSKHRTVPGMQSAYGLCPGTNRKMSLGREKTGLLKMHGALL
jgi:hypothetical protein